MKAEHGFTLIELVVVVALIGTMLAIATLNFSQLNEKYRVESSIKEIYSFLLRARNDATTTNIQRVVTFGASQVQAGVDTNLDGVIDGTPTTINFQRFVLSCGTGVSPPSCVAGTDKVVFDRRGLTTNNQTISITNFSAGVRPATDCLVISATRINMGLMTGGACVQR